ncbi:MAG TPA: hypothetical protein VNV44_10250 [Solirubrobacteraceae bacterium]|jgi:hypothetical protein|nr:hypothetical protein [Solirubrobacteraceae bacterium]
MSSLIAGSALAGRRARALIALTLATATVVLLAALPTAPAHAGTSPAVSLPPTEQVEQVLGQTPLGSLPTAELTKKLSELPAFEGVEAAALEKALKEVVEALTSKGKSLEELLGGGEAAQLLQEKLEQALGVLTPQLEALLGGNPQQKLTEALESTNVSELISKLLSGSSEPQVLIEHVLSALGPEKLQSLLGTLLSGEPFVKTTLEDLAAQLGTTPQALAEQFGKTAEQLPGTTMALVAPLANGEKLSILGNPSGVSVGVVKEAGEAFGLTGGTGGPGGTTTVTVQGTATPPPASPAPSAAAAGATTGKLKVLSHSFRGHRATIVVQVPSAGVLSASGKGLHAIRQETAKAERVTLHPSLTRAGTASVRRHRRHGVKVPIKVSFKPVSGSASTSTVAVVYR